MAYNRTSRLEWAKQPDACSIELALACVSGKWKLRVYDVIRMEQPVRYSAIHNLVDDISEKTLTAQLREMEQDGIVTRIVYPEVPPRVEYQLTDLGATLQNIFDALNSWGRAYIDDKNTPDGLPGEK